ncbi:MAG: ribulose-phosphate 3-epimerase [Clostridiales bacterium]|nr:ribulose-phosphate 3-epimerase [Clostridiales bacterium]
MRSLLQKNTDKFIIAPSVISADFMHLADEIDRLKALGIQMLHLDVMDGCLVDNITFGPCVVKAIREYTDMYLDVHIMVQDPLKYAQIFALCGVDNITVQYEALKDPEKDLLRIKEMGVNVGLAIDRDTPVHVIENVISYVDTVLVMCVKAGFGGQKYAVSSVEKIRYIRQMIENKGLDTVIEADGGINLENIKMNVDEGVSVIVAGTAVFSDGNVASSISSLKKAVKG